MLTPLDRQTTMPAETTPSHRAAADTPNTMPMGLDAQPRPLRAGSRVDVLLNEADAPVGASAPAAKRTTRRMAEVPRRGGANRAVLVVDAVPIARKFLALRLESLGYHVAVAEDAEQALEMIEQQAYAIVFIEAVLGPKDGVDGLRLCQIIKQQPDRARGRAPAVVMATGLAGQTDRVRGALAGCDAYLTKPIVEEELDAALGEVDPLFN